MSQNIVSLYGRYCYDATYPRHIGGFVGWLVREHGWSVLEVSNSGPRAFDRWVARPPREGVEGVEGAADVTFTSWTDGEVRVEAGGWVIMTNSQYKEVYRRLEKHRQK